MRPFLLSVLLLAGCPEEPEPKPEPELETLSPEPEGAPEDPGDGRLTCVGNNDPVDPIGNAIELTGYVRLLADPEANADAPASHVEAFDAGGTLVGEAWADPQKAGRVAVTVPIGADGFTGTVVVSEPGYLEWRFQTNRAVTATDISGWAFLFSETERDDQASVAGIDLPGGSGLLVGSVHDCDGFGVANAVVTFDTGDDPVYVSGFEVDPSASFTGYSGRFASAVPTGEVEVSAWTRLERGGPLVLLGRGTVLVRGNGVHAISLDPQ